MIPTINDVAAAAGVSRQTVSNVLNAPGIVRPATRQRVQRVIRELGYRPHASARRLRTRRAATIAVRIDRPHVDLLNPMPLSALHALTAQAENAGLRVLVYTAHDIDDEIRTIDKLTQESDVDALVLTSTGPGDPRPAWLLDHDQPFVCIQRPADLSDPRLRWVDVDVRAGVRCATEYLLSRGLTRIGYLGWPATMIVTAEERRRGWHDAMLAAGASPERLTGLEVASRDDLYDGRVAMRALLARNPDLEGVVAASDTLALSVMAEFGEMAPVVGFGNTPSAQIPGISSIDPRADMVARYVLALVRAPDGGATHYSVTPQLVVREPIPVG
jgi:DNA-binding LacI/PurR family transcriptional regulator